MPAHSKATAPQRSRLRSPMLFAHLLAVRKVPMHWFGFLTCWYDSAACCWSPVGRWHLSAAHGNISQRLTLSMLPLIVPFRAVFCLHLFNLPVSPNTNFLDYFITHFSFFMSFSFPTFPEYHLPWVLGYVNFFPSISLPFMTQSEKTDCYLGLRSTHNWTRNH